MIEGVNNWKFIKEVDHVLRDTTTEVILRPTSEGQHETELVPWCSGVTQVSGRLLRNQSPASSIGEKGTFSGIASASGNVLYELELTTELHY